MANIITLYESFAETQPARLKEITSAEAFALIEEYCPGFDFEQKQLYPRIWRGSTHQEGPAYICNPAASLRRSAHASNSLYNVFISQYVQFDSRMFSLICSSEEEAASNFGTLYLVIPRKGTQINVCPDPDIFFSFKPLLNTIGAGDLGELSDTLRLMFQQVGIAAGTITDLDALKPAFDKLQAYVESPDFKEFKSDDRYTQQFEDSANMLYITCRDSGETLYDFLSKALDPNKNGFTKYTYGEGRPPVLPDNELWLTGECLLINYDELPDGQQL